MTTFPLPTFSSLAAPIPAAVQAINTLDKSTLANATVDVLTTYTPSPVALIAQSCEALYADACWSNSTTSADAKVLCFGLADMCIIHSWWDLGNTMRGAGICQEMRRQLGDPSVSVIESVRPAVSTQYTLDPINTAPLATS